MTKLTVDLEFLIQVHVLNRLIHHTIIDEGTSTYIMSMIFWKSLRSLNLSQSPMTLKYFDGRTYKPFEILSNLQVQLGTPQGFIITIVVVFQIPA